MDALNVTDFKGKIVLCLGIAQNPEFGNALLNVLKGEGSGLILAQHTTDSVQQTADCVGFGIPCVFVDLDMGEQIEKYIKAARYITSFLWHEVKPGSEMS